MHTPLLNHLGVHIGDPFSIDDQVIHRARVVVRFAAGMVVSVARGQFTAESISTARTTKQIKSRAASARTDGTGQ